MEVWHGSGELGKLFHSLFISYLNSNLSDEARWGLGPVVSTDRVARVLTRALDAEQIGMAFAVKKLAGEPIYILTIDLPLERYVDNLRSVNAAFSRITSETSDPVYIVVDARSLSPTFSDILVSLDLQKSVGTGWAKASHVHFLLFGEHPLLAVGCKRASEYLGIDLSWRKTLEEALAHIRSETAYRAAPTDAEDTV